MVSVSSTLKIALKALSTNKMRSALTMLGVIIGVGAVITMLAIGKGASQRLSQTISSMGSNLLMVLSGGTTPGGLRVMGERPTLTIADAEAIKNECPAVLDAAPILRGTAPVVYGNQNWSTIVTGTTPSILNVREWTLASGRPFTVEDVKSATKVCLLGQTVAENLFGNIDPLGKSIRIKKVPFTVVGVLERKGVTPRGDDQDDNIYAPITTVERKLFGSQFPGTVRVIMIKSKSREELKTAEKQIANLLRQRHRIGAGEEDDFTVRNLTEMMQKEEESSRIMTILLGVIASVSLLVGGIGIMNIMLVSVTERTREIGIRRAVGAKKGNIRMQFITEALTLSLIGGIVGIATGILISKILSILTGWSIVISAFSILLAFGFSAIVGISFGFYPAYKASLLKPIEALRYE